MREYQGLGIFDYCILGEAVMIEDVLDSEESIINKIVILKTATPDIVLILDKVKGIICENGGRTCHLSLLALEMGVPCAVGVTKITSIKNHSMIKVISDGGRCSVFEIEEI